MNTLEILFFVLLFIVFYTYVGYGILLWILVKIKQSFISFYDTDEPEQETCIIRKSKCSRVSKRKVHFTKRSV